MLPRLGEGVTVATAKQGLISAGGQLQKLPRRVSVALLPSLHGATPTSPRGNHSRAPLLPFASTLSRFPSTVEWTTPGVPGATEL